MAQKPWREVAQPHMDVATGRYEQAKFAADLSQVLAGKADAEYQDARHFFERTYLTDGMRRLIVQTLRRLAGKGGDPVIQLKTAFGGGKTHSLLALYHLAKGPDGRSWRDVSALLDEAELTEVPKAGIAVLVGTDLDATKQRKDAAGRGVEVATLWGELAAQLGGHEAYKRVADADRLGRSPGAETVVSLLDDFGPALILIDELVAYVRNLHGATELPGGTFDSNLTFVQVLTEAARRSRASVLLAAIPESSMEIGGEGGRMALEAIAHTFGRLEVVWQPVREEESFEIVRRRLFASVGDARARDAVCVAFSRMYGQGEADFPAETREGTYLERLKATYPIHPEIFDRLYQDWSTIEEFQRTRGVLRLLASVIYELYRADDRSPLIMPGSIPLAAARVRNELTRYVGDAWNGLIDSDVDGDRSTPARLDSEIPRFGAVSAARRITRTIFLGTAPHSKGKRARGIEDVRIRLGVVEPGASVATFNDALARLEARLTYLYSGNGRYWFDNRPNLIRTVEDRAGRLDSAEVEAKLREHLAVLARERGEFSAVHVGLSSADIPDDDAARLVIVGPGEPHAARKTVSPAMSAVGEILEHRGKAPRLFKNALVFLAADDELVAGLEQEERRFLAWDSVLRDKKALNLDAHQEEQAEQSRERADQGVELRLNEAFCWLLVPTQADASAPIAFTTTRIPGSDSPLGRALRKLRSDEQLLGRWSPQLLRMELDKWLWRDIPHVGVKQLWEYFAKYPYLPRLRDSDVLFDTIREGIRSADFFGYATGVSNGSYTGLVFGEASGAIYFDSSSVLVKPEIAQEQVARTAPSPGTQPAAAITVQTAKGGGHTAVRFHATVFLDPDRAGLEASRIAEEVISHLSGLLGTEVQVTLEIQAKHIAGGFPSSVVRTVTENARTLKFNDAGFEEE